MPHLMRSLLAVFLLVATQAAFAELNKTTRIPQFSNENVEVWKTVIYPKQAQVLKMHRHERNRVVVAFDKGTLKITNDQGKVHYLKLEKNQAYYLTKDVPGERHMDENLSGHPIKVMVIELKS